jgi:asparagine synthase (glutamine-hydrolysing)
MCGIAGFIDTSLSLSDSQDLIKKMLQSISHRGPDFSDHWMEFPVVLGHNRLSIIDLAEVSNQPMHFDDLVITYNGELYNYLEMKEELVKKGYHFKTSSDTEVILVAFKEWGEQCVERFMGMWAFAIWNKAERTLFCSRDRFGIKPFYFIFDGGKFHFASEVKALKFNKSFNGKINNNHIYRALQLGWVAYKHETFFDEINALPEACNLTIRSGKINIYRYWDLEKSEKDIPANFEERSEKFRNLLTDSLKLHFRSDVEVGACLSGGLDSSAIVSLASTVFPDKPLKTFTIYYEGKGSTEVDERPYVYELVNKFKNLQPHYYSPLEGELEDALDKVLYHSDVPITSSSPISQYFVMKLAKQHGVTVLLDGQGSDEYLAGYMHTFNRLIGSLLKQNKYAEAMKILMAHKNEHGLSAKNTGMELMKGYFVSKYKEEDVFSYELSRIKKLLKNKSNYRPVSLEEKFPEKVDTFLYHLLFHTSLPSLLHYEDRNSMAFSLESRVPFLDHRLVEYAFNLPLKDKLQGVETKHILRKSLSGILPDAIRDRRDKKGFVTPGEEKWLKGPLKHLLTEDRKDLERWFSRHELNKIFMNYQKGDHSKAKLVWRLVVLNRWLKKV